MSLWKEWWFRWAQWLHWYWWIRKSTSSSNSGFPPKSRMYCHWMLSTLVKCWWSSSFQRCTILQWCIALKRISSTANPGSRISTLSWTQSLFYFPKMDLSSLKPEEFKCLWKNPWKSCIWGSYVNVCSWSPSFLLCRTMLRANFLHKTISGNRVCRNSKTLAPCSRGHT